MERVRPRIAWEYPAIQGLGNQALVSASDATSGSTMSKASLGTASEGGAESRVEVRQVIIKRDGTGTGFKITKHLSDSETEESFPKRRIKSVKGAHQLSDVGADSQPVPL